MADGNSSDNGDFQLTPPFANWGTGYKPPKFFDDSSSADSQQNQFGWTAQFPNGQTWSFGDLLPGAPAGTNASLTAGAAAVARAQSSSQSVDLKRLADAFTKAMDTKGWDALNGIVSGLGSTIWTKVTIPRLDFATGQRASIGNIDASSRFVPTQAGSAVAGFALPFPEISIGRRFAFLNDPTINFKIRVDVTTLQNPNGVNPGAVISGGGVSIEGRTTSGDILKLGCGAGRDVTGGGAGFVTFELSANLFKHKK
jgi:hypothetical protein